MSTSSHSHIIKEERFVGFLEDFVDVIETHLRYARPSGILTDEAPVWFRKNSVGTWASTIFKDYEDVLIRATRYSHSSKWEVFITEAREAFEGSRSVMTNSPGYHEVVWVNQRTIELLYWLREYFKDGITDSRGIPDYKDTFAHFSRQFPLVRRSLRQLKKVQPPISPDFETYLNTQIKKDANEQETRLGEEENGHEK